MTDGLRSLCEEYACPCHFEMKELKPERDKLCAEVENLEKSMSKEMEAHNKCVESLELQISAIRQVVNDELDYLHKRLATAPTETAKAVWSAQVGTASAIWEKMHETNDSLHTVDYRKLLSKYLEHVNELEGVTFIHNTGESNVDFSEEEIAELRIIDKEIEK